MVKTNNINTSSTPTKFKKNLEQDLKKQINSLSNSSLHTFIQLLLKYLKIHKACRNSKKAYLLLSVSFLLQEQIKDSSAQSKIKKNTILAFLQVFDLHKNQKNLDSHCLAFQMTQNILNATTSYIAKQNKELKINSIERICLQLLKISVELKLELALNVILRLLENESRTSVFSYLTNPLIPLLPGESGEKFTLVLDLDETLGHFCEKRFVPRPGVSEFLAGMSKKFELVLFTSSVEVYANYAMEIIDPKHFVTLRLYRQHLVVDQQRATKDLRVLGRKLERVLIIDNDPKYFESQPMNGIQIKSWYGDLEDIELQKIGDFLSNLEIHDKLTAQEIVSTVSSIQLLKL